MRRALLLAAVAFGIGGCEHDPTISEPPVIPVTPPPPIPIPTFRLTGSVRDAGDNVLPGASVTITDATQHLTYVTKSDSLGYFAFLALPGGSMWTVVVRLASYLDESRFVILGGDRYLQIRMSPVAAQSTIEVGKEYTLGVQTADAPCDPIHWDANAPCARLRFLAPRTGAGTIRITWASSGEVDVTLMSDLEDYLAYASGGRSLELSYDFVGGTYYVIWVHSYYGAATFKVRVDIAP